MKRLLATALISIAISSLYVLRKESHCDSASNAFAIIAVDKLHSPSTNHLTALPGKTLPEEPVCVLNQAGNIILPAVKIFQ